MSSSRILVTAATGKTGGAVVDQLLAQGFVVRALVHSRDSRSERLDSLGVETVVGDMHDPDQLHDALKDVQRAYYVPLFAPHAVHAAAAFVAAVSSTKLECVVQLSQWLSHRSHPSILTRECWLIEDMFARMPNLAHVTVNPGMFADNFLRIIDFPALLWMYPVLTGTSRSAPVSHEDIARVVAAVIAQPSSHAGMRYRPTGPELLSGAEMAAVIAKAVGHKVLPIDMPFWMFRKLARLTGGAQHEVFSYRDYLADHRAGAFEFEGGVTSVVTDLTGSPPEDFATIARRYAAMPFARQSWSNRLKAFARFNLVPFVPGYDLDRYQREKAFPVPPRPSLSIEDARWRAERSAQNMEVAASDARKVLSLV
jgi:uncharacterized protein YbjT (DUF2867 family)